MEWKHFQKLMFSIDLKKKKENKKRNIKFETTPRQKVLDN